MGIQEPKIDEKKWKQSKEETVVTMANVERSKEFEEFPAAAKAGKNQRRSLAGEWRRILYIAHQHSRVPN